MKTKRIALSQFLFFATLALVVTFTGACATVGSPAAALPVEGTATGRWDGTAIGAITRQIVLDLNQRGDTVEGTYDSRGGPVSSLIPVKGTYNGRVLSLSQGHGAFGSVGVEAEVERDEMRGILTTGGFALRFTATRRR